MIYMYACTHIQASYTSYHIKTSYDFAENNGDNGACITHHQWVDSENVLAENALEGLILCLHSSH